jgi:serine/threonine protein kinase
VLHLAPDYPHKNFPAFAGMPLEQFFPSESELDEDAIDLMKRIFVFDPCRRLSAVEALAHPFFD